MNGIAIEAKTASMTLSFGVRNVEHTTLFPSIALVATVHKDRPVCCLSSSNVRLGGRPFECNMSTRHLCMFSRDATPKHANRFEK